MFYDSKTTWQEIAEQWRKGETVWTVELGGLGPGYEQALQILLFEILAQWPADKALPTPETNAKDWPRDFNTHVNNVVHELDDVCGGFSGAQVGAAKATAWQFMHYGYGHQMSKPEIADRKIMVSKWCPSIGHRRK